MKKNIVIFALLLTSMAASFAQGYTDLGLPSGTIWKNENATMFYSYDEAVTQFGSQLPTWKQWFELITECKWSKENNGYKVTGPNGNSITLPAAGYRDCEGHVGHVGSYGLYWSSTPHGSDYAGYLNIHEDWFMNYCSRCFGLSVRLVKNK